MLVWASFFLSKTLKNYQNGGPGDPFLGQNRVFEHFGPPPLGGGSKAYSELKIGPIYY
jgi:hypothetical protein